MKVPFLNLKAQHDPIRAEVMAAIDRVIEQSAFAGGPFVSDFEKDFAAFCGAKHALGVGNGTDALWFALLALGVGPGDEVITSPATFMATAEAITYCGAKPVFVDIDEETYTLDPSLLEAAITPRTKAVMPVHLFGQNADMDPILRIAGKHGIPVVEDACQAHGAEYRGRKAGTLGAVGCFSFYPGKNLGAFGEGGGIVTQDDTLRHKMATLRDHGQAKKYYHSMVGWNGRMDGIQGAVLQIKLRGLAKGNAARQAHAASYRRILENVEEVVLPKIATYGTHVFHIYAVRVAERDRVMASMAERGVSCGIHYPIPVHLQEAYALLGHREGSFPVAERCAKEFLSLPMFPELTQDQVEYSATQLRECLAGRSKPILVETSR